MWPNKYMWMQNKNQEKGWNTQWLKFANKFLWGIIKGIEEVLYTPKNEWIRKEK